MGPAGVGTITMGGRRRAHITELCRLRHGSSPVAHAGRGASLVSRPAHMRAGPPSLLYRHMPPTSAECPTKSCLTAGAFPGHSRRLRAMSSGACESPAEEPGRAREPDGSGARVEDDPSPAHPIASSVTSPRGRWRDRGGRARGAAPQGDREAPPPRLTPPTPASSTGCGSKPDAGALAPRTPHVVAVQDFGQTGTGPPVPRPRVAPGPDPQEELRARRALPPAEAVELAKQLSKRSGARTRPGSSTAT